MKDFVIELHVALGDSQSAIIAALGAGITMKANGGTVRRYTVSEAAGPVIEDAPWPDDPQLAVRRAATML